MEAWELWAGSERRYHERRRNQNRWEWVRHWGLMASCHARISEDYQRRAEALYEELTGAPARVGDASAPLTSNPPTNGENKV